MKGRVKVIHEDQDRDLEDRDQRRKNMVSKKGNTQGYSEIGDKTRTRQGQGQGEDKDKARTRTRRGQGQGEDEVRTRRGRGEDDRSIGR